MKLVKRMLPLVLALALLAGCAQSGEGASPSQPSEQQSAQQPAQSPEASGELDISEVAGPAPEPDASAYLDASAYSEEEQVHLEDEAVALSSSPAAVPTSLMPVASGTLVEQNSRAVIDYSNTKDGYVMVKFTGTTATRIKVQVAGPSYATSKLVYTYDLKPGAWNTFVLSDGNGQYKVTVLENTTGTKYAMVLSKTFQVAMTDEFAPFLRPNQYVNYEAAPNTVAKAAQLVAGRSDLLGKVEAVYDFVVKNFTYDKQRAATVQSGYLPVLDSVLAERKGICFDYAALMAGMLRSQGVPCKLITGYVPSGGAQVYHAWISVWSAQTGWVEGAIYFNGSAWQRMDPTFASSANSSASIMQYIGNGSNYSQKYAY